MRRSANYIHDNLVYNFKGRIWKSRGKGGWYFITLPKRVSTRIRKNHFFDEEGWGRLRTSAQLGKLKWSTAIWYDSEKQTYLLPVKSSVRKSHKLKVDTLVSIKLVFVKTNALTGSL